MTIGAQMSLRRIQNIILLPYQYMNGEADSGQKNNSPNGWNDGEFNGRHENNSPNDWKDGELNGPHENNLPNEWTES